MKLIGLNRHQSWPYAGYAMPRRIQRKDARILKEELGCNMVRTSHYPQSRHFLDACDELGLLVMEEIPGWQHIGDEAWKERSLKELEDMIIRDYNRPSIVLWGVRINESQDDHNFYERTNALAHSMDSGRQTGGTRISSAASCWRMCIPIMILHMTAGKQSFVPSRIQPAWNTRCRSWLPRVTGICIPQNALTRNSV